MLSRHAYLRLEDGTWPSALLLGALAVSVCFVLVLAAREKLELLVLLPLVAAAPLVLIAAARSEVLNFAILLGLFTIASRNEAGIGGAEVLFAAYLLPYLGLWYGTRLLVYREPILQQRGDWAILGLIALATFGLFLGTLGGGRLSVGIAELGSFGLLALYFPFREFCVRRKDGAMWLLAFLVILGVVAVGRNLLAFGDLLASAIDLRGIAAGRIVINEVLIYFSAVAAGCLLLYARRFAGNVVMGAAFLLCALGVVLTQFRAFYLGLAVAIGLAFIMVDGKRRWKLAIAATLSLAVAVLGAYLVLGDVFTLIVAGVLDRASSIGTASEQDISFINRFFEYQVVWHLILQSPVIGHGLGVEFGFYDSINNSTWVKAYVHNAYLHMLYKGGIVGLGLLLYVVILAIRRARRALAVSSAPRDHIAGLFVLCSFAGLGVAALATVLFNTDTMLPLAVCFAIAASLEARLPGPAHSVEGPTSPGVADGG